jgi:hypothetical protein
VCIRFRSGTSRLVKRWTPLNYRCGGGSWLAGYLKLSNPPSRNLPAATGTRCYCRKVEEKSLHQQYRPFQERTPAGTSTAISGQTRTHPIWQAGVAFNGDTPFRAQVTNYSEPTHGRISERMPHGILWNTEVFYVWVWMEFYTVREYGSYIGMK